MNFSFFPSFGFALLVHASYEPLFSILGKSFAPDTFGLPRGSSSPVCFCLFCTPPPPPPFPMACLLFNSEHLCAPITELFRPVFLFSFRGLSVSLSLGSSGPVLSFWSLSVPLSAISSSPVFSFWDFFVPPSPRCSGLVCSLWALFMPPSLGSSGPVCSFWGFFVPPSLGSLGPVCFGLFRGLSLAPPPSSSNPFLFLFPSYHLSCLSSYSILIHPFILIL